MGLHQQLKACALVAVSLLFLPLSSAVLVLSYACQLLLHFNSSRKRLRAHPAFWPKTILVTGAGTAVGLKVSRALYEAGHNVIGADFEPDGIPMYARYSKAFQKFYTLRLPNKDYQAWLYVQDLLQVVQKRRVNLWINCSGRISTHEDAQARRAVEEKTNCVCFALDEGFSVDFSTRFNFLAFTKKLGLPVPEQHPVRSRAEIHNLLNDSHGAKQYLLSTSQGIPTAVRLPRRTLSLTYQEVASIQIPKDTPLILEQHLEDMERYATFAVIVRGQLKAFAASPVTDASSWYQPIPTAGGVGRLMLEFMNAFATRAGEKFTAQLSVEFRILMKRTDSGLEASVVPVAAQAQPGLSCLLFSGTNATLGLAKAYLDVFENAQNGVSAAFEDQSKPLLHVLTPGTKQGGIYFAGPDLITLILRPLVHLAKFQASPLDFLRNFALLANHVLFWREGTFEIWDPLPLFLLYHVFLPVHLVVSGFKSEGWAMSIQ